MKTIKTRARSDKRIKVRRDRQRSKPSLTKGRDFFQPGPRDATRTGNWYEWWQAGCGRAPSEKDERGKPYCPPGHAYYVERYRRGEHRRGKVLGRRKQRRKNNRILSDW